MKMGIFRKCVLGHDNLSKVSHLCYFIMILSNHNEISRISFFAGKYLPPFHEIFVQKIHNQTILTRTFLFIIDNEFSKFLLHILQQTNCSIVTRKTFDLYLNSCKNPHQTLGNALYLFYVLVLNIYTAYTENQKILHHPGFVIFYD